MSDKRFILNAEGFGWSKDINKAIIEGYSGGILRSASIVANGEAFDSAIDTVLSNCPDLGIGLSLNVTKGSSLCEDINTLTNDKYIFNKNFFKLLIKSYNSKDRDFMPQLEREFRRQIEKTLSKTKITHLSSVDNVHAIPKIFEMVCRLAKEYGIKYVKTHFEKTYIIPDLQRHCKFRYFKNLFVSLFLSAMTIFNEAKVHDYELKTNDYMVGIIYSSMMSSLAVVYGVMAVKYKDVLIEATINPCRYDDGTINNSFDEYLITKNKKLKEKIENLGFEITNYAEKED